MLQFSFSNGEFAGVMFNYDEPTIADLIVRGINLETRVVFHHEKIRELIDKINEIFLK